MIPKYRAWLKHISIMANVSQINFKGCDLESITTNYGHFWKSQLYAHKLENLILMQSTGLKNIFQDDIVSFSLIDDPETAHIGVVIYDTASLGWMIKSSTIPTSQEDNEMFFPSGQVSMALVFQEYIEAIGNIHANPELLTKESADEHSNR